MLCPFCGSKEIFNVRHDSDWGSLNSFLPSNSEEYYTSLAEWESLHELDYDIRTNYCYSCSKFGDFLAIHELLEAKNMT